MTRTCFLVEGKKGVEAFVPLFPFSVDGCGPVDCSYELVASFDGFAFFPSAFGYEAYPVVV